MFYIYNNTIIQSLRVLQYSRYSRFIYIGMLKDTLSTIILCSIHMFGTSNGCHFRSKEIHHLDSISFNPLYITKHFYFHIFLKHLPITQDKYFFRILFYRSKPKQERTFTKSMMVKSGSVEILISSNSGSLQRYLLHRELILSIVRYFSSFLNENFEYRFAV